MSYPKLGNWFMACIKEGPRTGRIYVRKVERSFFETFFLVVAEDASWTDEYTKQEAKRDLTSFRGEDGFVYYLSDTQSELVDELYGAAWIASKQKTMKL